MDVTDPAVMAHLQLSDRRLSWALLAFAAGAIVGMQAGGRVVDRLGAGRVLLPAVVLGGARPAAGGDRRSLYAPRLGGPTRRRPGSRQGGQRHGVPRLMASCCLVGEGAAADWSAVYLRDTLGTTAAFAASA